MKMREDQFSRDALTWTAGGDPDSGREAPMSPAPGATRREAPLSGYGSADELYAAMGAARRANLAKLDQTAVAPPAANVEPAVRPRPSAGRLLAWSLLAALAAAAAGGARRVRRRSN